jgi:hypothetical protein
MPRERVEWATRRVRRRREIPSIAWKRDEAGE